MIAPLFFCAVLQAAPPSAAQHMEAGVAAHKQGDVDVAIAEFKKAAQLDPSLAEAFLDLGEEYVQTHDYVAAIAPLKRALELRPDLEDAHLQLGYALLAQGLPISCWTS
jgi:tetratricopeptide (TPR) repeat protein